MAKGAQAKVRMHQSHFCACRALLCLPLLLSQAAKAVNEREKGERSAAAAEAAEAAKWDDPGSKKGNKKADQQAEAARKRDEKARLQAEEDAATNSIKSKASGPKKGKDSAPKNVRSFKVPEPEISSVNASGIDNVLDAVDVVNAKNDKASLGSKVRRLHLLRYAFSEALDAYDCFRLLLQAAKDIEVSQAVSCNLVTCRAQVLAPML